MEMLDIKNDDVADNQDMKKVVEISLNVKVASELFNEDQINENFSNGSL